MYKIYWEVLWKMKKLMSLFNPLTNLINFINFNSRFWRRVCAESSPKLSRSSFLQSYNRCFYHTYANGNHGIQGANGRAKRKLQNSKTWNDKNSREVRRTCTRNQKQSSINWWVQVTYGTIHILCKAIFRLFVPPTPTSAYMIYEWSQCIFTKPMH